MQVEKRSFPGWSSHPSYAVNSYNDYLQIAAWMHQFDIEYFLLSSGAGGYVFQVRRNHELFLLRWS